MPLFQIWRLKCLAITSTGSIEATRLGRDLCICLEHLSYRTNGCHLWYFNHRFSSALVENTGQELKVDYSLHCLETSDTPLTRWENDLTTTLIYALSLDKPVYIMEDLNCKPLSAECRVSKSLNSIYELLNLMQLIPAPTRVTETLRALLRYSCFANHTSCQGCQNNPWNTNCIWKAMWLCIPKRSVCPKVYSKEDKIVVDTWDKFLC